MFAVVDKVVYAMAGLRMVSSLIELSAAMWMLHAGTAAGALQVNAVLALVGPTILVTVTLLGVAGMGHVEWWRLLLIGTGVLFILKGVRG
ncbi:MAG: YqhV family protein [Alicyclobacillus sp.]|nr:YqhV family protein [Alicyclobacillus sp.]